MAAVCKRYFKVILVAANKIDAVVASLSVKNTTSYRKDFIKYLHFCDPAEILKILEIRL